MTDQEVASDVAVGRVVPSPPAIVKPLRAEHDVSAHGRSRAKLASKRAFDLIVGSVMLLLLLPVFLAVAIAILLAEGRPVFYRQRRVGRYGNAFTMLKFRSMVTDAHERLDDLQHHNERTGPLFKIHRDPRVTRVGRFLRATSFDELPQFFNVLGGTMSLVGPRPALFEERASFPPELLEREVLRPGLTGLWQVEARSDPDFDRYHQLDLDYVEHWTLWLDVKLLVRTPFVVARDAIAHARRERTLEIEVEPVIVLAEAPAQEH
ncbi:MAG TPA: sugar transferase [Acidimicrobiia bacterium]|jgi:lipopolysaccharide/colanic/teichoic acid biosynthesis glycosyltransferase